MVVLNRKHNFLDWDFYLLFMDWMDGVTCSVDLSMETRVLVSGVVYGAGGAVCFKQLVVSFDFIAVTFLSLLLDVVGVFVLHSVLEFVFGVSL